MAKINDWLQLIGVFGIIASLIFVGLELQQSREIAIADIYQQRAAMIIDTNSIGLTSDVLYTVRSKLEAGESLSQTDQFILDASWNPHLSYQENNHFQYQLGMLSEEQWQSTRNAMRWKAGFPPFIEWWGRERSSWRASFAQVVDELIEEERAANQ